MAHKTSTPNKRLAAGKVSLNWKLLFRRSLNTCTSVLLLQYIQLAKSASKNTGTGATREEIIPTQIPQRKLLISYFNSVCNNE